MLLSSDASKIIVNFTLAFVAFIVGVGFTRGFLARLGKVVVKITIVESLLTFAIVALGVYVLTRNLPVAIIFGALGPATAPAGTVAAIHDCRARGTLSRITIGVVGLDDAIAIIIFVAGLASVRTLMGGSLSFFPIFEAIFIEIALAIAIGLIVGIVLAYTTKRTLRHREDIYIASAGSIILSAGLAEMLGASIILTCMVLGVTFININPRGGRTIHATVESMIPPIFVVFFVVAGLELKPELLIASGSIGIVYVASRILGKCSGASLGSKYAKASPAVQKYLGFALLSQAGVAIGLAILVSHELAGLPSGEELGALAITIITATTVVFEIIGPIGVRYAVTRSGETPETRFRKRPRRPSSKPSVYYDVAPVYAQPMRT